MIIRQFDLILKENASYKYGRANRKKFCDAESVYNFCISEGLSLGEKAEENVYLFSLSCRGELIGMMHVGKGGSTYAPIDVKSCIIFLLQSGACAAILAHNHPSGNTDFSSDDRLATHKLKDACDLLSIKLLDHIIIGRYGYTSLKQLNEI